PAAKAGVKPGWLITQMGGKPTKPLIAQAQSNGVHELQLTRSLLASLSGSLGETVSARFLDGGGQSIPLKLRLATPKGELSKFGNLPPSRVWYESRKIGTAAYARFNLFLDLPRVMASFHKTVEGCKPCDGLIIDLRGNPGGIGGMAMGMAGFLTEKPNQRL